jgi:hypothetical protein
LLAASGDPLRYNHPLLVITVAFFSYSNPFLHPDSSIA